MMADTDELIIEQWYKDLQNAIPQGKKIVKEFIKTNYINIEKNLGFKLIDMNEDGVNKILKKEIRYVNDKTDKKIPFCIDSLTEIGEGATNSGFLVQSLEGKDEYNRITTNHYIYAIFINNLKV